MFLAYLNRKECETAKTSIGTNIQRNQIVLHQVKIKINENIKPNLCQREN